MCFWDSYYWDVGYFEYDFHRGRFIDNTITNIASESSHLNQVYKFGFYRS